MDFLRLDPRSGRAHSRPPGFSSQLESSGSPSLTDWFSCRLRRISLAVHSAGTDDESFRRRTGVVKGVTGDQRQQLTRGRLQNPRLVGTDDIGEPDTVDVLPSRNRHSDEIAILSFGVWVTSSPAISSELRFLEGSTSTVSGSPMSSVPTRLGFWSLPRISC